MTPRAWRAAMGLGYDPWRAVTLTVGQRFESDGCGDWKPQGS
jgi:hypothetical protein